MNNHIALIERKLELGFVHADQVKHNFRTCSIEVQNDFPHQIIVSVVITDDSNPRSKLCRALAVLRAPGPVRDERNLSREARLPGDQLTPAQDDKMIHKTHLPFLDPE